MQRLRITFAKRGLARFIGNLDLHRTWERTLRRAGASLVYSQGFHPSPKLQLASALPLGNTSEAEVLDIWLRVSMEPNDFIAAVTGVLPSGIEVLSVKPVDVNEKSLQSRLCEAEYEVELSNNCAGVMLERRVAEILASCAIMRKRRGKDYDLRPLIKSLEVHRDSLGTVTLRMLLVSRPGATGRAEEVLAAMGVSGKSAHRTALFFVDNPD